MSLLACNAATAVAQVSVGPAATDKGPDPRAELQAEAMLPDVDPDLRRSVIRNDMTLLGGESLAPKTRESSQSLEALREQVRKQIKMHEAEIVQIDAGIANLKSLLEAHKKAPGDGKASADYVRGVNQEIVRASNMKARYEATIAALRSSAAAMTDRETALQAEIEGERAILKQLLDQVFSERVIHSRELPPLKNAEVRIFHLAHATPLDMAQVIDSILGPSQVRLSVDGRTNSLVVMGDKESLEIVQALLAKMDQPAESQPKIVTDASAPRSGAERSLSLRIFWLADGLPEGEGEEPDQFLPASVLKAVARLGVDSPRLVVQTATSLAMQEGSQPVNFSTNVPAVLFQQRTGLRCEGTMNATKDDRANVEMRLTAGANGADCELQGSLATPLGHFMVLGTANSVAPDFAAAGVAGPDGIPMGGGMAGMEGGMGMGMAPGDPAMMGAVAPAKFNTSRFAFVVQVIEGESFAPAE